MIEKYGLFDSLEGDVREYTEADFALLVKALGRDGVRGGMDALKVTPAASGLGVNIAAGFAIVQGRFFALEDDGGELKKITMSTASANPRIDRIVLKLNYAQRTLTLGIVTGTEAVSPTPPPLTRNTTEYMLSLAQVLVGVGAASLKESNITDERSNEDVCGIFVTSGDEALARAVTAASAAAAAQATADKGVSDAAAAQATANKGVSDAAAALNTANGKMPKVTVTNNRIAVFDGAGGVKDSGIDINGFHRCKFSLSGTTLTITTVS